MRLNDLHGLASMPSFRRWRSVLRRSITSNERENFSQSSSLHWSRRAAGVRTSNPADATAEQQLGEDEPGPDGLAEPHVVGDQEADARHAERLQERDELEVLHADAAVEGAGDGLVAVGGVVGAAAEAQVGRERRPAGRQEERVKVGGGHGACAVGVGKRGGLQQRRAGLQLPE